GVAAPSNLPSGAYARLRISAAFGLSTPRCFVVSASHTMTLASELAEARVSPSGLKTTAFTQDLWADNVTSMPLPGARRVPSMLPVASPPDGRNATDIT